MMRNRRRSMLVAPWMVLPTLVAFGACRRPKPDTPKPPTPYFVCAETDARLNWYDARAHALFVRIFQLSRLEHFRRAELGALLAPSPEIDGLEGAPTDRPLAPGATTEIEVLRRDGAHFIGIVGGYYTPMGEVTLVKSIADLRAERRCDDLDDDDENWVRFGPNAIETVEDDE